jgi:hypothetical protein
MCKKLTYPTAQCCCLALTLMRFRIPIRIQRFRSMRIRIPFRIRIHSGYGSRSGSGSRFESRSRVLVTKSLQMNKNQTFLIQKCIYSSLGLHEGRPSHKESYQHSEENIKHLRLKISSLFLFCRSFLPSWIWIRSLPTKINVDPDPDPQHCCGYLIFRRIFFFKSKI